MLAARVWKTKMMGKLEAIRSIIRFGLMGIARSPNNAEFSNEVPNRNKNLGSSADGAKEDIAGDVEHVTAEESSRYLRQHSTATADKQATIEEATQTLPPGTVHGITGMYTPSVKQILYVFPISQSACYH